MPERSPEKVQSKIRKLKQARNLKRKFRYLHEIITFFRERGDLFHAKLWTLRCLRLAKINGDIKEQIRTWQILGDIYAKWGRYRKALNVLEEGLSLAKASGDLQGISTLYSIMGLVYGKMGENGRAISLLRKSLRIREDLKDASGVAKTLGNLGLIFWREGLIRDALEVLGECLRIHEEEQNTRGIALTLIDMGLAHSDSGDPEKALECFHRAIVEMEKLGDQLGIAVCENNIGEVHLQQGRLDKAFQLFESSKERAERIGSLSGLGEVLGNLAEVHLKMGELSLAKQYLLRDIEIAEKIEDKTECLEAKRRLALVLLEENDVTASLNEAKEALHIAQKIMNDKEIGRSLRTLGEIYVKVGKIEKGEECLKQSMPILKKLNLIRDYSLSSLSLGRMCVERGEDEKGKAALEEAVKGLKRVGDIPHLEIAQKKLAILEISTSSSEERVLCSLVHLSRYTEYGSLEGWIKYMLEFLHESMGFSGVAFIRKGLEPFYVGERPKDIPPRTIREEKVIFGPPHWIPVRNVGRLVGGIYLLGEGRNISHSTLEILSEILSLSYSVLTMREDRELSIIPTPDEVRKEGLGFILGKSPKMLEIIDLIKKVGPTKANVLIRGESGTGKELVAKTLHLLSRRRDAPFVKINCAAIPETLLESELFGIERGTATGVSERLGKFEQADQGTIFLDEIGDMSLSTQAKILRVLQEREFERVGGRRTVKVDVRLIAATNQDLAKKIREGAFREDLFYRLNVISFSLPSLRERKEDIPLLTSHFIRRYSLEYGKAIKGISREAMRRLMDYHWPGNVRELENIIERAIILAQGDHIQIKDLPVVLQSPEARVEYEAGSLRSTRGQVEKYLILSTLKQNNWNVTRTARALGITRRQLYRLMDKHQIRRSVA